VQSEVNLSRPLSRSRAQESGASVVLLCASLGRLEKEQPGKGRNRGIISFSAAEIRASKLAFLSLIRRARFVTLGASMSK